MADSTTEIDLDSVIDRLLEGESFLLFSPLLLSPASPGRHPQSGWGGLYAGPPSFFVLVVAPCLGSVNRLESAPSSQGNQPKCLPTRPAFALIA